MRGDKHFLRSRTIFEKNKNILKNVFLLKKTALAYMGHLPFLGGSVTLRDRKGELWHTLIYIHHLVDTSLNVQKTSPINQLA